MGRKGLLEIAEIKMDMVSARRKWFHVDYDGNKYWVCLYEIQMHCNNNRKKENWWLVNKFYLAAHVAFNTSLLASYLIFFHLHFGRVESCEFWKLT